MRKNLYTGNNQDLLPNTTVYTGWQRSFRCGGFRRDFFTAFQRNFSFTFFRHTSESIADEIAKYGGGRTADHGIHGIKFFCKVRRQKKCAKLIVIAKTAKTGKDSGQKDAYATGSDGSVERDTFSS